MYIICAKQKQRKGGGGVYVLVVLRGRVDDPGQTKQGEVCVLVFGGIDAPDPIVNRFRLIHPCNGRTDGRTDGVAIAYTRYSTCCRFKKSRGYSVGDNFVFVARKYSDIRTL